MQFEDYEHRSVPAEARRGFGSLFSVWITFQVSTVMLFFGAITIAHLSLWRALIVLTIASAIIAVVSGVTGYVGAKTGLSTALLCERIFGVRGGKAQQLFQGLIEFGWFVVIVGLTGDAVNGLLHLQNPFAQGAATFFTGILSIISVYFGFRGIRWVAILLNPIIVALLVVIVVMYSMQNHGLSWIPTKDGPDFLTSISIAVGTFITGAALSADLMRFAVTPTKGSLAGMISFMLTIPSLLLVGALISMTNAGNPDFVQSVAKIGAGWMLLAWVILANWTSADTTLYLAIIPFRKLTPISRGILVVTLGLLGSFVAALGVTSYLTVWLTWLSILLPPLAGPIFALAFRLWRKSELPIAVSGIAYAGILAWVSGVVAAFICEYTKIGLAPIIGMLTSFVLYIMLSRPRTDS